MGNGVLVAGKLADGRLDYLAPNGTSFSSPHVAGVAALVLSIQPSMTVTDLENLLITTAQQENDEDHRRTDQKTHDGENGVIHE